MDKYEVIIFWSNEDNAYVANIPEPKGHRLVLAYCLAGNQTCLAKTRVF